MMMSRVRSLATSRAVRRAFASAASQGSGSKPAPVHNGKKVRVVPRPLWFFFLVAAVDLIFLFFKDDWTGGIGSERKRTHRPYCALPDDAERCQGTVSARACGCALWSNAGNTS